MPQAKRLIIGTRGSKLALIQTQLVADALKKLSSKSDSGFGQNLTIEIKIITTKGDTNQSPIPLDTVGKNWFTAEIEAALVAGEIDIAVHSLKDLPPPSEIAPGLATIPVLERADPRDVLISNSGALLKDLQHGAVVGTDSARRKILLLEQRPDLVVKSIRGNVDTRLKKLHAGVADGAVVDGAERYDAIVIAAAGLERLDMLDVVTEFFDPTIFSIAPGQGILAAQTRKSEAEILALLRGLEHAPTRIAAVAELAFTRAIGGGCKLPVGCYAKIESGLGENGTIEIYGMMGGEDEKDIKKKMIKGPVSDAVVLAEMLARELL